MTSYSVTYQSGLIGAETTMLFKPRIIQSNRRAVIFAHGAAGTGGQLGDTTSQPSLVKFFGKIAAAGYVVLSADWGGPQTYGNDTELAAMEAGWSLLQGSGLCATDKVILTGASMGTLSTHRFARDHPASVAGINVWIPAPDIENLRTLDFLGSRSLANTAWGLPAGSYIGGADQTPVPTRGRPMDAANIALLGSIPTHMWYSTADPASTNMATYLAARGSAATGHVVSTSLPHGDAAIGAADIDAIIAFLDSVA